MNQAMAAKVPPQYGRNRSQRTGAILFLIAVSANLIGLFAAVYVSSYLRAGAGEPDILFPFYYGGIALAALADGLWLDELVFKGSFRRSIQGKTGRFAKQDEIEAAAASIQGASRSFPVVVIVCGALTYAAFNLVNHGFNSWWDDVGEATHTVTRPDSTAEDQVRAIQELSVHIRPEVLGVLEQQLSDGDPEVEAWAAWAIGRHRNNEVMNINRVPALVERVRKGDTRVKREAMLALARLQHQAIVDEVQAALEAELDAGETIDIRLIWGLGYLQVASSLPVLDRALYHPDTRIQRFAAWALSQHRDSGKGRQAADLLEQRLPAAPLETKCAIIHSLGVLADERSNLALMHAYDGVSPSERERVCERITVHASPDGELDREDLLMPQERLGMKTIQAMGAIRATTPQIRAQVEPWLEALIADEGAQGLTRESAQSLLSGIRAQRDDSPSE